MEIIHVLNMGHKIFFVQCIEQLFLNMQILFHLYIPWQNNLAPLDNTLTPKKQLYFFKYLELGLAITHVAQMKTAVKSAYTESV